MSQTLRRRLERAKEALEALQDLACPGRVLIFKDLANLTPEEAAQLAEAEGQVRRGGALVLLPDNGRGDYP